MSPVTTSERVDEKKEGTYTKLERFRGFGDPVTRNDDVCLCGDALGEVEEHAGGLCEALDGYEDGVENVGVELAVGGPLGELLG